MFQEDLLIWYEKNARKLEFREKKDAYSIWVSEIMAQQTRIEAMLPYYHRFMEQLPTLESLAQVEDEKLNKLWQGLGYYSRARNLKKCAIQCMEMYDGKLPETKKELMKLAGIGPYTAGAIASIAYNENVSCVDGNVIRVFSRLYAIQDEMNTKTKKYIEQLVDESLTGEETISSYNQALMELGALVCIPSNPRCEQCPICAYCEANKRNIQSDLPHLPKKKERRKEKKKIYIYVFENKIHLIKRADNGLLAGLYGFDEQEQHIEYYKKVKKLKSYTHIFSHVEWQMSAQWIEVDREWPGFYTIEEIDENYAIPSAFQPFYQQVKKGLKAQS